MNRIVIGCVALCVAGGASAEHISVLESDGVIIGVERPRGEGSLDNDYFKSLQAKTDAPPVTVPKVEGVQVGQAAPPVVFADTDPSQVLREKVAAYNSQPKAVQTPVLPAGLPVQKPQHPAAAVATKRPVEVASVPAQFEPVYSQSPAVTTPVAVSVAQVAPSTYEVQPTVPLQQELLGTAADYLIVRKDTDRVYVSKTDGKVYFHARKGSLLSNVEALLSATDAELPIVFEVSDQHVNLTDVWISGATSLDVLDALLKSYIQPHPIKSKAYGNRVVSVYYDKKGRRGE